MPQHRSPVPVLIVMLLCALLLSCSSAPKPNESVITVKNQADSDFSAGDGYYRQGRYDLALQFFSNALSEYTSVDEGEGIVRSYAAVGRCYVALGSLDDAESIFLRARERAMAESPSLQFDVAISLGELYLARGNAEKARAILTEEMQTPATGRTAAQSARLSHDLGTAEKNLGNLDKALEYFGASLKIHLGSKLSAEAAADYYMIASVHSLAGRYDEALANALLALSYDKKVESSPGIAKDLYALGVISSRKGDQAAAFDYYQRAYNVCTTLGFRDDMKKALAGLISSAEALGRQADADSYRKTLADLGAS